MIKPLLRHSTCPVCRQRLGAQEEAEDQEEEAANEDEVGSDEDESDTDSTSDEEVLHPNVI